MNRILFSIISISFLIILLLSIRTIGPKNEIPSDEEVKSDFSKIVGVIKPQETMEAIFDRNNLSKTELSDIARVAKKSYNLSKLSVGNVYSMEVDRQNRVREIRYEIDESSFLSVVRNAEGFSAEKVNIEYQKKAGTVHVKIKDNLVYSMPSTHSEYLRLALQLSDIYAWDIDFFSDIREGDSIKILVEELWAGDVFRGYGNILASEFLNNGTVYSAYRFEHDGDAGYYDSNGKSLRKTLLRSPLKFRYISSRFSKRRFHPVLRIYRPHLGIDYVAPAGTPVSATGSGKVVFSGYKGQNGRMVRIRHNRGLETYYGHLSKIPGKIKRGTKVSQGEVVGYVGSTGLSTGPHLDYRIKLEGRFVNPLKIRLPRGKSIPKSLKADFKKVTDYMNIGLSLLNQPVVASSEKEKTSSL